MRNTLRKFISLILVLILVFAMVPASVFAGSDDDNKPAEPDRSANSKWSNQVYASSVGSFPGTPDHYGTSHSSTDGDSYILAVTLGRLSNLHIKEIIVSYYTQDGVTSENASNYKPYKQVLEVERMERSNYGDTSKLNQIWGQGIRYGWTYYGSKYGTYYGLNKGDFASVYNYLQVKGTTANEYSLKKDFTKYYEVASQVVRDIDTTQFPSATIKNGYQYYSLAVLGTDTVSASLQESTTEYLRFKPLYHFGTLESISIIFSQQEGGGMSGEAQIYGWQLWTLNGNTQPTMTNYAYFSDKVGLTFDGTVMYESSTTSNAICSKNLAITQNGVIRYFNTGILSDNLKDEINGVDGVTRTEADNIYRSDVMDGLLKLLTCVKPSNATASPSLDAYDFVIKFADEYGAGLEQFNVSPMADTTVYETGQAPISTGKLNLSDVLTATITYKDSFDKNQEVTLPIISNAILNMIPEAIEVDSEFNLKYNNDLINKIKSGEILQYAQQGDSISFRVEFPNFKELVSMSIKYYDGYAGDTDEIAIERIGVYRGFRKYNSDQYVIVNEKNTSKTAISGSAMIAPQNTEVKEVGLIDKLCDFVGIERENLSDLFLAQANKPSIKKSIEVASFDIDDIIDNNDNKVTKQAITTQHTAEEIKKAYLDVKQSKMRLPSSYYTYDFSHNELICVPDTDEAFLVYISNQDSVKRIQNGDAEAVFNFIINDPDKNKVLTTNTVYTNTYLFEMTTSNLEIASTNAEAYVKVLYKDSTLADRETTEYNLKDLCQDYLGYQTGVVITDTRTTSASVSGEASSLADVPLPLTHAIDVSYQYAVQAGNKLGFTININNVKEISGIYMRISGSEDDWQISTLDITKLSSMGSRTLHALNPNGTYENISEDGTVSFVTNRYYTRAIQGETLYSGKDLDFLVQRNGESTLNVQAGSRTGTTKLREDYSDYEEYMPYIIASSDLKMDTAVQNFEVVVHVGNDDTSKDNCGSNNMYYFQLEFKNGKKSGYVLANKQLAADGFRSGVDESFTVSTNQDFGDVVAITIIPDDTTSNADPLDKLCIDSIDVIKKNQNSPNKRYVIENIGWIGTAYIDTNDKKDKATRKESEMAYNYAVNHSAYIVSLEVAVTYGDAVNTVTQMYGLDAEHDPQFQGDMTCDLHYITSTGESKVKSGIQMVKAMYDYMNRTAPISKATGRYQSNTSFMFRPNTTDRFIVDIEDCTKIEAIVFHATPEETTTLKINQVNIFALRQQGTLAIKSDGAGGGYSYYRRYDTGLEPTNVGTLEYTPGRAQTFIAGQNNKVSFYITGSDFPDFESTETYDYIVEQVPISGKDTFDIYYYLQTGTPTPAAGGYDFSGGIQYKTVNNKTYESVVSTKDGDFELVQREGYNVLFAKGVPASNFSELTNIWADAGTNITSSYYIDHALVQQVRSGVVINTMNVKFGSGKFSQKGGANSSSYGSMKNSNYATQTVKIQLAPGTALILNNTSKTAIENPTLTAGKLDIGVSLIYSTNSLGGGEYSSPITFATDNGTEKIHAGSVLTFEFNEYDVKEILGIKIQCAGTAATGYLDLHIGGQMGGINIICTEQQRTGSNTETKQTGWYSIYSGVNESLGQNKILTVTGNYKTDRDEIHKVEKVDLTIKTAENGTNTFERVKAVINYNTQLKGTLEYTIEDLSQFISTEKWTQLQTEGETSTISFMVPGFNQINYIKLIPLDCDGNEQTNGTWTIEKITHSAEGNVGTISIPLDPDTTGKFVENESNNYICFQDTVGRRNP